MILCDNGCGTVVGSTENPFYQLRVIDAFESSEAHHFCSVGCASDWLTLTSQGLKAIRWGNLPGFVYDSGTGQYEARSRDQMVTD